ncbi:MAG: twin-arginine translocation signal domain-containing protein, partial [bacterium]|nr:twin-arginine translocation signal domain-containing protein [bacterium]
MGETRREFLKNAALLAGGFVFGQTAKANASNTPKVQAIAQKSSVLPEQEARIEQKIEPEVQSVLLAGGVILGQAVSESKPFVQTEEESQSQEEKQIAEILASEPSESISA